MPKRLMDFAMFKAVHCPSMNSPEDGTWKLLFIARNVTVRQTECSNWLAKQSSTTIDQFLLNLYKSLVRPHLATHAHMSGQRAAWEGSASFHLIVSEFTKTAIRWKASAARSVVSKEMTQ